MFDNFGFIIERKRELHPKRVALVEHGKSVSYTYEELDALSNKTAQALVATAVKKGDRVMAILENSAEFFGLLFGCNKIGAVLVPVNFRLSPDELAIIFEDVAPVMLVYQSDYAVKVERLRSTMKGSTKFIVVQSGANMPTGDQSFADFVSVRQDRSPGIRAGGDDPSVILFTSGSTGKPKGVIQTHRNTFTKSVDHVVDLAPRRDDVLLTMAPVFHVGGLNILTMSMFHVGGSVIVQSRFEPGQALDIIESRRVTLLFAIPTMLKMMVANEGWANHDISSLRYVVSGGEPVPQRIREVFSEKGVPVLAAYGLTEGSSMSSFQREFDHEGKAADCIGKPPTHLESKVVDEAGKEVGTGEVGELIHRGPTVMPGYWNRPEETKSKVKDGWLYTGDLVRKDENGFYYLVGRRDDMIKSGGEKIYPSEVEEVIYRHPKVAEVVVFGRPDETWGNSVWAVVVGKKESRLSEEEIIEYCKRKIAGYKCPRRVILVDEMPHTGSGKVDRKGVKELYGGH